MSEFSDEIVDKAWERSGGYCECEDVVHGHSGKCHKLLLKSSRGDRDNIFGWEAHSISGLHLDSVSDCEILCWDPCHKATLWPLKLWPIAKRRRLAIKAIGG